MWSPKERDTVGGIVCVQWHSRQERLEVLGKCKAFALIKIWLLLQHPQHNEVQRQNEAGLPLVQADTPGKINTNGFGGIAMRNRVDERIIIESREIWIFSLDVHD
jgi:hypothetical protein